MHPDTPSPFDRVRNSAQDMPPKVTYQVDPIKSPCLHELVQIRGKFVPIGARACKISPDSLRIGTVIAISPTTQRDPDLETWRLLFQVCDLREDIVRGARHGYNFKRLRLDICKRKVEMGQRANWDIIDRSFGATSCRQTPPCPVAGAS